MRPVAESLALYSGPELKKKEKKPVVPGSDAQVALLLNIRLIMCYMPLFACLLPKLEQ